MTGRKAARRGARAIAVAGCLVIALCGASRPAAAADADSSIVFDWGALYRSRLSIERASDVFRWNDEASASHINDRLAILGNLAWGDRVSLFAKGATGYRLEGPYRTEGFSLDQGHALFRLLDRAIEARLFSRERVFRTSHRLMEMLSDDAPLVARRGEGLALDIRAGRHAALRYVESIMRGPDEIERHGGLPVFHGGGDIVRMLRLEGGGPSRWHTGLILSQARSIAYGDAVMIGADAGLRVRGIDIMAELARSQPGTWEDLREHSLFDLRTERSNSNRPSAFFSPNNVFAAEAGGIAFRSDRLGSAGIIPGYRFQGASFINPQGEIESDVSETYAVAWWRPAKYDALLSVDAADGLRAGEERRMMIGRFRARYRGGFELGEGIICREGARSAGIVSLLDENALSRMRMTVRIDELGGGNDVSCFAEGSINLSSRLTAKSALYLHGSRSSAYAVELEMRPRERFLLRIAFGSFMPAFEEMMLGSAPIVDTVSAERYIQLFARVWFGGI